MNNSPHPSDCPAAPRPRMARCAYFKGCGNERPSDRGLAFFESGEAGADDRCVCGYAPIAHDRAAQERAGYGRPSSVVDRGICTGYAPRPDRGHDTYYCGCHGWD